MPPPILRAGDRLMTRFRVTGDRPIGTGQFAEVFRALDESAGSGANPSGSPYVAVKIEREEKTSKRELAALKDLQGVPGVCDLVASGVHDGRMPFIVMQLGGENLADVRRKRLERRGGRHTRRTVAWIGATVLDILRGIHERGYVHRDVKPGNVTLAPDTLDPPPSDPDRSRPPSSSSSSAPPRLFLIDLGLAKKYERPAATDATGAQEKKEFRGSNNYASIATHEGREQRPSDDLWALLYVLAEATEGTLPWRAIRREDHPGEESFKTAILRAKAECRANPETLCPSQGTPGELIAFSESLRASDERGDEFPRYDDLKKALLDEANRGDERNAAPLDWERGGACDPTNEIGDGNNGNEIGPGSRKGSLDRGAGTRQPPPLNTPRGSNPNAPRAQSLVRSFATLEDRGRVPARVMELVKRVAGECDIEEAMMVIAGVAASAVRSTVNMEDAYVADHLEKVLDEVKGVTEDAKAELARKRKR